MTVRENFIRPVHGSMETSLDLRSSLYVIDKDPLFCSLMFRGGKEQPSRHNYNDDLQRGDRLYESDSVVQGS